MARVGGGELKSSGSGRLAFVPVMQSADLRDSHHATIGRRGDRLATHPVRLVAAQWLGGTPSPAWWSVAAEGGGQVIEQATHLYDLARHLAGEAEVIAAASNRGGTDEPAGVAVADATTSLLRFNGGAIGSFANSRRIPGNVISMELASDGLLTTLTKGSLGQGDWHVTFDDGTTPVRLDAERDPYENQAVAFLDAVGTGDRARVLCTYADALATDRLTRAVVAATGASG